MDNNVNFQINIGGNVFAGVGKLQGDFTQLVSVVGNVDKSINTTFNSLNNRLKNINFNAVISQVQHVSQAIAAISSPGIGFEQSLADLSAITGTVGADLVELGKTARRTGYESGLGAKQAVDAFTILASQIQVDDIGLDGLKVLQENAITLSHAAGMTMTDAANALAGTINQFGFEAGEAGRVINVLAAGSKYGAAEINDLAQSFKVVGSQSAIAGVSLEETAGALEILSKNNIKGSEAGTHLRNIILSLQTVFGADLKKMTLTEALDQLKPKLNDAAFMSRNFGRMSMASAQFLVQNADAIGEMTGQLTDTNTAQEQAAIRTETVGMMMQRCRAKVDDLKIGFFELTGSFGGYAAIIGEQAVTIAQLVPLLMLMGKGLQFITSASKITALCAGIVKVATAVWTGVQWLFNAALWACPLTWVVAAIAALVGGVVLAWNKLEGFRKIVMGVWDVMKEFGKLLFGTILDAIKNLIGGIGTLGSAIAKLFKGDFKGAAQDALEGTKQLFKASPIGMTVEFGKNAANADFGGAWERGNREGADSWAAGQDKKQQAGDVTVGGGLLSGMQSTTALREGPAPKLDLSGKGGRKRGDSKVLDLNRIVPDLKGSTAYSAIASKLAPIRAASVAAAASVALPLTVAATTLPDRNPMLDPEHTEYMAENRGQSISMSKFCDTIQIHIANADGKGYEQIQKEVTRALKQVFDDYGA